MSGGWSSRAPDVNDRRQILIGLTQAGRDLLVADAREQTLWLAAAMAEKLTGTEMALLSMAGALMDRVAQKEDRVERAAPRRG